MYRPKIGVVNAFKYGILLHALSVAFLGMLCNCWLNISISFAAVDDSGVSNATLP